MFDKDCDFGGNDVSSLSLVVSKLPEGVAIVNGSVGKIPFEIEPVSEFGNIPEGCNIEDGILAALERLTEVTADFLEVIRIDGSGKGDCEDCNIKTVGNSLVFT